MKRYDLTGQTFNHLTVLELSEKTDDAGARMWKCRCDCGNITYTSSNKLISGGKKSCGCIKKGYIPPDQLPAPRFAPFTDCVSYRTNINIGCFALNERLCENTGKCSFYKQRIGKSI